jgi:hypothetical protein
MKKLNTFKKATPLLLLTAIAPAMATDVLVPLNFTTLPVITITPIRDLDFGAVLSLTLADECTLGTNDVGGTPLTPSQEGTDSTDTAVFSVADLPAANVGLLSDDCAGGANGDVGIYEISSFANANITVTVTEGTATDISFSPAGYVTNIAGTTFTRENISLGAGNDADVSASETLTAFSQAGTNRAIIGGTITNFAGLNAGQAYATDFNLNVVYQ